MMRIKEIEYWALDQTVWPEIVKLFLCTRTGTVLDLNVDDILNV